MPGINFKKLPFDEALKYMQQKVNLPTEKWTDIWEGMHSRAFVVAGATKNEILTDLHNAINSAIENGTTISEFRKTFDETIKRTGWSYKGERGWRTATIFNTNLRVAYAAGHWKQMTDKDVLAERPYLRYVGGLSANPRPLHLSWNGITLRADDPWWQTHAVPNGWNCKCQIVSTSESEAKRDGYKISDKGPDDGTFKWTNPNTGEIIDVPNGIDPGWAYNPGQTAWGDNLEKDVMDALKAGGEKRYERLTQGNWESEGQKKILTPDKTDIKPDFTIDSSKEGITKKLEEIFGEKSKIYSFESGAFRYDINVSAEKLAEHLKDKKERAEYLPLLPETLKNPQEVWLSFEKDLFTNKTVLRERIIKVVEAPKNIIFVTDALNGHMQGWTIIPNSDLKYLNKQRVGKLIWAR